MNLDSINIDYWLERRNLALIWLCQAEGIHKNLLLREISLCEEMITELESLGS